ncbi:MAG: DUF4397 domain-containing protein [Nannocystaceae bacterium]|nr:DUF4397 domain-containing protein [Nannocystaceae bacterium]
MKSITIDRAFFGLLTVASLTSAGCYAPSDERGSSDTDAMDAGSDGESPLSGLDDGDPSDDESGEEGETGGTGDDDNDDDPMPEPMEGNALVRVIHGAPDAPAVDIYVEGSDEPVITDLAYTETSDWLEVPAGAYNFQVRVAGGSPLDIPIYETGELTLPEGAAVSALAAGLLDTMGNNGFRAIPLVEGWDSETLGQARVRIVHAGSDAPAVDIDVGADGEIEIEAVTRFSETGAGGVSLPAEVALRIGIAVDGDLVTTFTTPELPDGGEVIIIATGLLGKLAREDDGFGLLAVGPQGTIGFIKQDPEIIALHASPDAPEVDLCAGDTLLASHLTFGGMQRAQVSPGNYEVALYPSPSNCGGTAAVVDSTGELEAGQRYLLLATGELSPVAGEPPAQIVAFQEHFTLDMEDDAVLRLVHGAPAPEVDVGVVTGAMIEEGNVLAVGLKWPNVTDEIPLQPLTYQLGFAAAGQATPLLPIVDFHVPAEAGVRGWVVAAGDLTPEANEESFRLMMVDTSTAPWSVTELMPNSAG